MELSAVNSFEAQTPVPGKQQSSTEAGLECPAATSSTTPGDLSPRCGQSSSSDEKSDGHLGSKLQDRLLSPLARLTKRTVELTMVVLGGLFLVPLFVAIAIVIKCGSRGPVFYHQERVGRGGMRFRIWKFRTMLVDAEDLLADYLRKHPELRQSWERERKLDRDPRIVPGVGHFLRKSSLDELPQLWNVLRGEMSVVGPRPLPEYHLDQFDQSFRRFRERVTPGVTGAWQVFSRSDGCAAMFVKWDTFYIQNWSLLLDLRIILLTLKVILSGKGAA